MSYFSKWRAAFFFQMATEVLEDLLEEDDEVVEVCVILKKNIFKMVLVLLLISQVNQL